MGWLATLHSIGGTLMLLISLVAAVWATARYRRSALPPQFFTLSQAVSILFGLQALLGLALYAGGHRPPAPVMHLFYPFLVLLAIGLDHMLRPGRKLRLSLEKGGAFREPVFFTYLWWFLFLMFGRSWTTGLFGV